MLPPCLSGVKRAKSSADVKFALIWKMGNFFVLGMGKLFYPPWLDASNTFFDGFDGAQKRRKSK
jgi:hypothetical protein